jgi:hypothetical protein
MRFKTRTYVVNTRTYRRPNVKILESLSGNSLLLINKLRKCLYKLDLIGHILN